MHYLIKIKFINDYNYSYTYYFISGEILFIINCGCRHSTEITYINTYHLL